MWQEMLGWVDGNWAALGKWWFLAVVGVALTMRKGWFVKEQMRNEKYSEGPPADYEIRWHLAHMREDVGYLVFALRIIVVFQAGILIFN